MRRRPSRRPEYLSASKLAEMGYCEVKVVLVERRGDRVTPDVAIARERGKALHEQFHREVVSSHNRNQGRSRPRTGPCFIASVAYGPCDWRTDELRAFRDECLLRNRSTAWMVSIYYRVSPPIAAWLSRHPGATAVTAAVLDLLRHMVVPRRLKDETHDSRQHYP